MQSQTRRILFLATRRTKHTIDKTLKGEAEDSSKRRKWSPSSSSSSLSSLHPPTPRDPKQRLSDEFKERAKRYLFASVLTSTTIASIYLRQWRDKNLETLPLASESGFFYVSKNNTTSKKEEVEESNQGVSCSTSLLSDESPISPPQSNLPTSNHETKRKKQKVMMRMRRDLRVLCSTVERAGLMGTSVPGAKSVKDELEVIRSWHYQRGYRGALVLRDLSQPLYSNSISNNDSSNEYDTDSNQNKKRQWQHQQEQLKHHQYHQRECYYLYYEVLPNGQTVQQIFCRGTTLASDVWTCLKYHFVYDSELECYLHAGFRDHANRILEDLEPLLSPPLPTTLDDNDREGGVAKGAGGRATVELCGHSLGGAVAAILAMKLKKRRHAVVRLTTIASPRFCTVNDLDILDKWLPEDTLRIEDDLDGVPFLPPHYGYSSTTGTGGVGFGNKLWFVCGKDGKHSSKFISRKLLLLGDDDGSNAVKSSKYDLAWVDSVLVNFRIPEITAGIARTHRIPSYLSRIKELINEMDVQEK